ncbi:hypothetical protein WJX73_002313 [Symbiochloris irregularis]|uniref:Thymidine kinase n=1 Tax=Symbiochloris irregularis TaxID=706552 RepID=A0AAW1P1N8_9CHLO
MAATATGIDGVAQAPPSAQGGEIQLILGPMFSGKTTELLRRVRRYKAAARKCFLVSYQGDTRYGSAHTVTTHDQVELPSHPVSRCEEVDNAAWHHDVIAIDEGQFLPDLVEHCERWANRGLLVIVAALNGTFQRQPFPVVVGLLPLAESITKLSAVCMTCHKEAAFTWRTAPATQVEMVGGADSYKALCRGCYARAQEASIAAAASTAAAASISSPAPSHMTR